MSRFPVVTTFILISFCISWVSCQIGTSCNAFQSLSSPQALSLTWCDAYASNTCCNSASAKRAFNWVLEDDGCGVIPPNTACRSLLTNLACAVNCLPGLIVTGLNANSSSSVSLPGYPVVCKSFADQLQLACSPYSWCGTNQKMTTDCKFLALTTTGKTSSLQQKSLPDTCSWVAQLSSQQFLTQILGVSVYSGTDENAANCISLISVTPASGWATASMSCFVLLLAFILCILLFSLTSPNNNNVVGL